VQRASDACYWRAPDGAGHGHSNTVPDINASQLHDVLQASIFYSYFAALGLDVRLEDPTRVGRIDISWYDQILTFV